MTLINKKGDFNLAENYRGITLLSCVSKLFTSILNTRLNKWAENNSKFDDLQHGFRENKGTVDAMFLLQTAVDIFLSKHDALYISFIDLRKAFDKTHHGALWYKLYDNDISIYICSFCILQFMIYFQLLTFIYLKACPCLFLFIII